MTRHGITQIVGVALLAVALGSQWLWLGGALVGALLIAYGVVIERDAFIEDSDARTASSAPPDSATQ